MEADVSGVRTGQRREGRGLEEHVRPTLPASGLPGPGWGWSQAPAAGHLRGGEGPRAREEGGLPLCGAQSPPVSRLLPQEQRLPGTSAVAMATTEVLTG